ncbi:amidohydrolase [Kribbella turkmenica]|uniref:Amidohydrolase n=1 Tax=Kribbella turkmenica TaxID=2530375 RepID=A0A4R4XFG9_9ACTN|nr:amidohydrolase family protein [Kribbella turkmenica]TDD29192.1 amidohydrolase [Kribbella turkmenica]
MIQDSVVVAVEQGGVEPPAEVSITDFGADSFLMPGMIDAHSHLCIVPGEDAVQAVVEADDGTLLERARTAAAQALAAGITTIRDLGDRSYTTVQLRDELAGNPLPGPHLVVSGPPITTAGGHCHFLGGEAQGRQALRAAVRERADHGCDVLKVMASGGGITKGSSPYLSQYTRDELTMLVDYARSFGMSTAAHAHGTAAIIDATAAGFDTLEHASFATPDGIVRDDHLIDDLARSQIVISATMGFDPASHLALARNSCRTTLEIRQRLHELGAPIVVGTDAGIHPSKPHDVLPHGVADLPSIGFTPIEALRSATGLAAHACGVGQRKGRLIAGYDADILVLADDPTVDLSALHTVRAVYRLGTRVR